MKVLMIGDIANVSSNLKKGLEQQGHTVVLVKNDRDTQDVNGDYDLSWKYFFRKPFGSDFDIVHVHSPNLKKLGVCWRYVMYLFLFSDTKFVCHWHGSDLRHPWKAWPLYHVALRLADVHLYSTIDLAWWLRKVSDGKKVLFRCPVDTSMFQPDGMKKEGSILFQDGARGFSFHKIEHKDMPGVLNRFKSVDVHNFDGLDDTLLSVMALEAASCGCRVNQLPWLNREWVVEHASITSQVQQLLNIYNSLLKTGERNV